MISSLPDKVLFRREASKRVEEKQSVCSQVLVRQIYQLVNAAASGIL
jgi:hypothetical protein